MDKTLTADFAHKSKVYLSGLWQYDHGITLAISGISDSNPEIHFSTDAHSGGGITVQGITVDGVTTCRIPDSLLAGKESKFTLDVYHIYAWVYVEDTETGRTVVTAKIEVKRRVKPSGYVTTDDEAKTWASKGDALSYEDDKLSLMSGKTVLSTVEITAGSSIEVDSSLTKEGAAADAKAVGDNLNTLSEDVSALANKSHSHDNKETLDKITSSKINEWDSKSDFSGSYNDLTNKPTIPTVPTAEIEANTAARHTHDNKTVLDGITASNVSAWDNKSDFDGKYTSLTDKPFDDVVITVDENSVDTSVPSAKAVYTAIQDADDTVVIDTTFDGETVTINGDVTVDSIFEGVCNGKVYFLKLYKDHGAYIATYQLPLVNFEDFGQTAVFTDGIRTVKYNDSGTTYSEKRVISAILQKSGSVDVTIEDDGAVIDLVEDGEDVIMMLLNASNKARCILHGAKVEPAGDFTNLVFTGLTDDKAISVTYNGTAWKYAEESLGGTEVDSIAPLTVETPPTVNLANDVAIGNGAKTENSDDEEELYNVAVGAFSTASGAGSTASGAGSTASGAGSTASGAFSTASGAYSTASGAGSTASGAGSTASGAFSTASAIMSVALGLCSKTYNDSDNNDEFCVSVGGAGGYPQYDDDGNQTGWADGEFTRRIIRVSDPVNDQDAATKKWVETYVQSVLTVDSAEVVS